MAKVNLNLSYWDIFEKSEPIGVFEVANVQNLFGYVFRNVAEKYGCLANLYKETHERYLLDAGDIPQEGDIPEPESVGHSIDIRFGRTHDDPHTLIKEINALFRECKHYDSNYA